MSNKTTGFTKVPNSFLETFAARGLSIQEAMLLTARMGFKDRRHVSRLVKSLKKKTEKTKTFEVGVGFRARGRRG